MIEAARVELAINRRRDRHARKRKRETQAQSAVDEAGPFVDLAVPATDALILAGSAQRDRRSADRHGWTDGPAEISRRTKSAIVGAQRNGGLQQCGKRRIVHRTAPR